MRTTILIEDSRIRQTLVRIAGRLTPDPALHQDLVQESLIHLWKLELKDPGHTTSWYLMNCRFHMSHLLQSGRSLDSPKRAVVRSQRTIDSLEEEHQVPVSRSDEEMVDELSAQDLVTILYSGLRPRERAVLYGLARGLVLREVAAELRYSYPSVLKYRRRIARLALKLGIGSPGPYVHRHGHCRAKANPERLRFQSQRQLPG